MGEEFTDENMNQLLRRLVDDTGLDDTAIDEIADSPQLWWGVKRRIETDVKPLSTWKTGFWRRWLMFGAPATVAALLLFALFTWKPEQNSEKPEQNSDDQAVKTTAQPSNQAMEIGSQSKSTEITSVDGAVVASDGTAPKSSYAVKNTVVTRKGPRHQPSRKTTPTVARSEATEVKSEFIALSYARNPDSGQIVRVKVPSSMMVSLGLVASVEKPSSLVNAELLVGDDGMTHAIRFIR